MPAFFQPPTTRRAGGVGLGVLAWLRGTHAVNRLAVGLSLLAVVAALFAPVAMLAQDLRANVLGGVCTVAANAGDSNTDVAAPNPGSATQTHVHCHGCGFSGWAPPTVWGAPDLRRYGHAVALWVVRDGAVLDVTLGLPWGRGPPTL